MISPSFAIEIHLCPYFNDTTSIYLAIGKSTVMSCRLAMCMNQILSRKEYSGFDPKWAIAWFPTCAQNLPFQVYLEFGSSVFFESEVNEASKMA